MDAKPCIPATKDAASPSGASRRRQYSNVASAMFLFLARVAAAVVQLRLVERAWGGSYTGLNVLCNQVLLYVTLLELGLAQAAISLLYEPIAGGNFAQVSALITAVRHDVRRLTMWGAAVLPPVLTAYAFFIHSSVPLGTAIATLWLIAASGLIQLASVHFQVYLNAAERIDRTNYVLGAGYLAKTFLGLALAIHWHQYLWLPAATVLLSACEFAALRKAFYRLFPSFCQTPWEDAARLVRARAKFVLIHKVAGLAFYQSDFIILSLTTSLIVVKDYAKYQYVSAALLSMVGMVASALTTSIARQQLYNHADARRQHYVLAQFVMSVIGAVIMLGYCFSVRTVIAVAFGQAVDIGWPTIWLFGAALFLNVVKTVDDVFIAAKGAFQIGPWIPAIEVPIFITLGTLLSERIGFPGILVASIVTNLTVSVLVKGIVLAGPVFDSSRKQWFRCRAISIVKGLLLILPAAALYVIFLRPFHGDFWHMATINISVSVYVLVIMRRILLANLQRERVAA